MPIKADFHLHSSFSGDSKTPMEEMILKGISLGLNKMCFTEHMDMDYPDSPDGPGSMFLVNGDSYLYDFANLKEKYKDKIELFFGIELGLQPEIVRKNAAFVNSYPFDFVIGSSHICHGKDPYYPSFYEGRSDKEAYREYFESILENMKKFSNYDVYGHLDYTVRYGKTADSEYFYRDYADIFEAILQGLIDNGKGIEINTGGLKKGMKDAHPCREVIRRYRELGGEIITVGSDSHETLHIADRFDYVAEVLKDCGFRYYTVFSERTPEFIKL